MLNQPKVFIVVLNYNGKEVIKKCLTSLFKLDYPNFEVVVVDNDSTDGSLELAKGCFSRANFIKNAKNLGYATGNNVGIRFALERMADYVLLLNNDTEVENDFLNKLVEVAESEEKIGLLSPVIFDGKTKEVWFAGGEILWNRMSSQHKKQVPAQDYYESEFITGCSMLVRASVFREIGLLDEDYFLYWEDADFSLRAKKQGFKNVVVSSSWIYHFEASEKNKKNKIYWLVLSGLIFFKKNTSWHKKYWIETYLTMRKAKNLWDMKFNQNEIAVTVNKAYVDFKNANL
ncbi:MAG: glycosyltransferase family 2 protein [Parcubacteria group bacterium]|jgi:GT2 family glycosyltransferase